MQRITFVGITLVAVVALALTAASVETLTIGIDPEGGDATPSPGEQTPGAGGGATTPESGESDQEPPDEGGSGSSTDTGDPPLWQVVVSVTLLAVGGVVVIYGLTCGEGEAEDTETQRNPVSTPTDAGNRPRLSADAPPTNDVYRVWLALREAVADDGETSTPSVTAEGRQSPADVAATAIDAGYDEAAVEGLTREFCAVRYGRQDATPERERRARAFGDRLGVGGVE